MERRSVVGNREGTYDRDWSGASVGTKNVGEQVILEYRNKFQLLSSHAKRNPLPKETREPGNDEIDLVWNIAPPKILLGLSLDCVFLGDFVLYCGSSVWCDQGRGTRVQETLAEGKTLNPSKNGGAMFYHIRHPSDDGRLGIPLRPAMLGPDR